MKIVAQKMRWHKKSAFGTQFSATKADPQLRMYSKTA